MLPSETAVPKSVLLRLDRRFGLAEATALQQALARMTPGSHLTFDFSAVREFQDVAVASLAEALRRYGVGAEVLGLSLHQRRMLRYFGVVLGATDQEPERTSA
jgi:hypothetical protein